MQQEAIYTKKLVYKQKAIVLAKRLYQSNLLLFSIIAIMFGAVILKAISLDMHKDPSMWAVDAMPTVLSKLWFNHKIKYTNLSELRQKFYLEYNSRGGDPDRINTTLKQLQKVNLTDKTTYEILGNDDKGIIDFVSMAFRTFGVNAESILKLYLVLLGLSCIAYVATFHESKGHLLALAIFLYMLAAVMPAIRYNPQLTSIMALRVFPLLSIVACFHSLCFLLSPNAWSPKRNSMNYLYVAMQIALMFFVYHMRTTALWQIGIVGLTAIGLISKEGLRFLIQKRLLVHSFKKAILIIIMLIASYSILKSYRYMAFPSEYLKGKQIVTRVFWHNIFSGFALHPSLSEKYKLRIDDMSIIDAAGQYLLENGRDADWAEIGGNKSYDIRWAKYDPIIAEMFFDRCKQHRTECLETFLFYKPISLFGNLKWIYGYEKYPPDAYVLVSRHFGDVVERQFKETSDLLDAKKQRMQLFGFLPVSLLIIFVASLSRYERKNIQNSTQLISALVLLLLGSYMPSFIGYPGAHVIAEFATIFPMWLYCSCFTLACFILSQRGKPSLSSGM